ncbi:PHP domain-containing protein [Nocardioides marmoriginsengisoli]|uniref:PHP domain-containing protein n=1 Tax=Nocardioides marmoriginsengisoli TaxID=661483 RepID=A0A3N0CRJ5_9ACTN|nr:PHP domain-containing protein [Nocardioides marmoriginsengisoli]
MRIDLHTHSDRSDGTDDPGTLMAKAAQAGLDVVALTDHDTTAGWADAQIAADHHGIRLIRGIELATKDRGRGQHLLGYGFDPAHPALVAMLQRGTDSRDGRIPTLLSKLRGLGIDLDEQAIRTEAGAGSIGRPHVAAIMVRDGHVPDQQTAFEEFLAPHGRAYVERYAPTLEEAIGVLNAAGGVAVLAHARGQRGRAVSDERFDQLAALGLAGIEVDHQEHDARTRADLRALAQELELVATGSSDYHGSRKANHDLGCNLTDPDEFQRLLGNL